MSRKSQLTLVKSVILREKLKSKNNPTKENVFSVIVVRVMVIFGLSVLLILRNNKRATIFLGLMRSV